LRKLLTESDSVSSAISLDLEDIKALLQD
jgi:hypothetical protein